MLSTRIFAGCVFSLSLNNIKDSKVKKQISDEIKFNGGEISFGISKQTTHLVTCEKDINESTFVVKNAYKSGCWVVLPSFIFDSAVIGRRDSEWNHMILNKKPACEVAFSEEEFLERCFRSAVSNINGVLVGNNTVENSLATALHNIKSLNIGIISQYQTFWKCKNKNVQQLTEMVFDVIPTNRPTTELPSTKKPVKPTFGNLSFNTTTTPTSRTVDYKTRFKNPLQSSNKPSFMERAEQKRKEWEEKTKRLAEEKEQKELLRQQKEEERLKREEDRKIREENERRKTEELRAKQEAERLKQKQLHEQEAKKRFEMITSTSIEELINSYGANPEEEEQRKLQEEKEKESEEKKRKIEAKIRRKLKKKEQKKQFKDMKNQIRQERNQKYEEEQEMKAIQERAIQEQKEFKRQAYAARQEKKRLKELSGQVIVPVEKPFDDDRKLFVGGISFRDLEKLPKKPSPDVEKTIKQNRVKNYFKLFEKFGVVTKKKDLIIEKKHCFIIYQDKESLEKAISTLSSYEERAKLCKEIRDKLFREDLLPKETAKLYGPSPHFYIRRVKAITSPDFPVINWDD